MSNFSFGMLIGVCFMGLLYSYKYPVTQTKKQFREECEMNVAIGWVTHMTKGESKYYKTLDDVEKEFCHE